MEKRSAPVIPPPQRRKTAVFVAWQRQALRRSSNYCVESGTWPCRWSATSAWK